MQENYKLAYDHISRADSWDDTLWYLYAEKDSENTFCGNYKDLNETFSRGLYIAINEPDKFKTWNEGFISGCGWGIDTLAEWYIDKLNLLEEQDQWLK